MPPCQGGRRQFESGMLLRRIYMQIFYKKWISEDDPDVTEYYRIIKHSNGKYNMIFVDLNNNDEDAHWGLFKHKMSQEEIAAILTDPDTLPSSKEEFFTALACRLHITVAELERAIDLQRINDGN